jgi:lipoyl-dependent peroxiredoxin
VARDAEGTEERLAVFEAAGGGPGFEENVDGVGLAGAAEREGSFFRYLIGGGQELADEGEGGAAFQGEEGLEHLSGDGGFGVAGAGFEAEEEGAIVALHFGEGAGGIGADGGGWFGEGVDHVAQRLLARQVGAGREGQQADAAKGASGILLAAPYGLHLNVCGAAQEGGRFAMAEILERAGDGILAPTLGIAFDGVIEEAVEGAEQVGEQLRGGQFGRDVGRFCGDQIDAVGERLAQGGEGRGWRGAAEAAEGFELFFNPAMGHEVNSLVSQDTRAASNEGVGAGGRSSNPIQEAKVMKRTANAQWSGDLKAGKGNISTASGVLTSTAYSFGTRFAEGKGTNPEELLAAAHAGCFTMALSAQLGEAGLTAENLETVCTITFEKLPDGWAITESHLELKAKVPGASEEAFEKAVQNAKSGCPVSKLYKTNITLSYKLEN